MKSYYVKVDIKLFYQEKGVYRRGVKNMIRVPKELFRTGNKPAFSLSLKLHKRIFYICLYFENPPSRPWYIPKLGPWCHAELKQLSHKY